MLKKNSWIQKFDDALVGDKIYKAIHPSTSVAGGDKGAGSEEVKLTPLPNGIVIVEVTTLALPQTVEAVVTPADKGGAREVRKNLFLKLLALETACSATYHAYGNKKMVQLAMLDARVFQTLDDGVPTIFMKFFTDLFASELPTKIKEAMGGIPKVKSEDVEMGADQKPGHMFEATVVASFHEYLVGLLNAVKKSAAKLDPASVIVSSSRRIHFPTISFTEECCAAASVWGAALPTSQIEIDIYAKAYLPEWGDTTISPASSPSASLGSFMSDERATSPFQLQEQKGVPEQTPTFLSLSSTPRGKSIRPETFAAVFPFLYDLFLDRRFVPVSRAENRSWGNWGGPLVERLKKLNS